MEILSLTDNLCALPGYKAQHGLSLYIKTQKHMILFDLGQDSTFIRNARKLGVDIADIDTDNIETFIKDDPYAMIVFDTDNCGCFTAEKLSDRHCGLNLIMISDSEQYAVDAFRLHVSDFWLYPYTAENVEEAFRSYYSQSVQNAFISPACCAVSRCFAACGLFVRIASSLNGSLLTFRLEQTSSSDVCHEICVLNSLHSRIIISASPRASSQLVAIITRL